MKALADAFQPDPSNHQSSPSPSCSSALTTFDEEYEDHYNYWTSEASPPGITSRHGYLQSLIQPDLVHVKRKGGERPGFRKGRGVSLNNPFGAASTTFGGERKGYRSLSAPLGSPITMATAAEVSTTDASLTDHDTTAPNSPPELSYSKSSKSSDSGSLSDCSTDGEESVSTEKFDGLSIEENISQTSIDDSNLKPESRPTLKRPAARSISTTIGDVTAASRVKSTSPPVSSRENRFPSLEGQVNGALRESSLGLPRGLRRGVLSPTSPRWAGQGMQQTDSRSPSPSKSFMRNGVCVSPGPLSANKPSNDLLKSPGVNGPGYLQRRSSWQPGRKTTKELEAECNDDDDEEVPDDAVLQNVPVSPMPGQRMFPSPQPSRSTTPSPNRKPPPPLHPSSLASHKGLHSANVPKNAKRPSLPKMLPNGQYAMPRSPRSPRNSKPRPPPLKHAATLPIDADFSIKHRSKSWQFDLNDESRHLSAALEEFAERESMEKHGSGSGLNSNTSSPPRSRDGSAKKRERRELQRSVTTTVEMELKQKGSVMIDPLPISKEKEAALTQTRPSWLPPKCQKEEKRHVKEWEAMMQKAAQAEAKRVLKERLAGDSKEDLKGSVARLWEQHVIPNWDESIKDPRTRELWWRGVSKDSRPVVWQKAIGNDLGLSEASFQAALKRAHDLKDKIGTMPSEERGRSIEAAWLDAIARDVHCACPSTKNKEKDTTRKAALSDVLQAYAMYRSDIGYVYGTHLVAGLLCTYISSPAAAFIALANLLNRPLPLAFLVHDQSTMARVYDLVLATLSYKLPALHAHLTATTTDVHPEEWIDPLFRCLFAYHMPAEHVTRVWDIVVFEGDSALVRAAVAVLAKLESSLYGSREEILAVLGWGNEKGWELGPADGFIDGVRKAGKIDARGDRKLERVASATGDTTAGK